ncbi:STAS domain-containing protein [Streptomyces sp. NBC_00124]|uniref:STAS domain-containing protein n=1 Tax=Streptomyces sp. NBC_00124 TaxID=2975662 RepID=UPI0022574C44|nr:STAS domain-containing protein [Streptomyces sp. NBC_00124]MCX5366144.1 STAS domain-containing protein [Streptomyces sp. NBC_00124]
MHDTILEPVGSASWPPVGEHALLRTETGLLVGELHGDIDLATAAHLSLWFDSLAAVAAPGYVVDLRPVSFIDSAGLNVVLRFRRRVIEAGCGFALLCDTGQLRLLRANGTADVLNPFATLAEAVSGLTAPVRLPRRNGRP